MHVHDLICDTKSPPSAFSHNHVGVDVCSYLATFHDKLPKHTLPNCTECYGCSTKLVPLAGSTNFLDRTYINEKVS